jgi:hypothetical protein
MRRAQQLSEPLRRRCRGGLCRRRMECARCAAVTGDAAFRQHWQAGGAYLSTRRGWARSPLMRMVGDEIWSMGGRP